ncbi:hypothetical protein FQA47_000731 [Oryzias melastigma]|uniref:Uncharacterized protein n=1 Tax=Oryzias melastigma TaxID=30732 RepID=A0A834L2N0_ORYME|nr:hypothetical protein FQA47_000731 [Oryzias melastigma]
MSCSCCNHLSGREKLLHEISTEEEEEEVWRMDVSDLRQQYRSCRERHQEVLLFGTVSEERFEAFSIVPVAQGLTLPWEPISSFSSTITFDCNPKMYDPLACPPGPPSEIPTCCVCPVTCVVQIYTFL